MACHGECESCDCISGAEEQSWQEKERIEQAEHERSLTQLLFWSAIAFPTLTLLFGLWCLLIMLGVLSESPVLGGTVIILLFVVWHFLITRK